MRATKKTSKKISWIFFLSLGISLFFSEFFYHVPKSTVFSEIGNNPMRARQKNTFFFFGNARPA